MRIGYCIGTLGKADDPLGLASLPVVRASGADYVELSLSHLAALSEDDYHRVCDEIAAGGLPSETCNNFFPGSMRLTGPSTTPMSGVVDYVGAAAARARALGVGVVVFGSSGAKNVPEGFPRSAAFEQLVKLLKALGPVVEEAGVAIAIEPLNRIESNLVNTAAEGLALARAVDHPSVGLLVDSYHVGVDRDELPPPSDAAPLLRHVHVADVFKRGIPVERSAKLETFLRWVARAGYRGRVSIEASVPDTTDRIGRGVALLKQECRRAVEAVG